MKKLYKILAFTILIATPVGIFGQRKTVDLIISGGTIVTMESGFRVIDNGAIAISGKKIEAVGTAEEINSKYGSKRGILADGKVIIPGLVNTHTHIPMTLFRGISDDLDLNDWLTQYIFPAEAKNVDENFVRVGTRLGLAEMIRSGTTTYCDMYYFEDAIASETEKAGVRAILGATLIDFPAPDFKTFDAAISGNSEFIDNWKKSDLITPAVAPHAVYTVSEEHLKRAIALSKKMDVPLVTHLAEAKTETEFTLEKKGVRPIAYAEKVGLLTNRTVAAHVIQANDEELDILNRYDVGIAHNPESNMKLAAGVAPVPAMLRKKLRLGLGTDGAASNNDLNLFEEMDTAAKLHKVYSGDPKVATAREMVMMATIGGARALHMEDKIGSIEAGKLADIVIIDFQEPELTPMYNIYSHLVYAAKADNVETVIINGRIVMQGRQLRTLDREKIMVDATILRNKIVKSLQD